MDVSRPIQRFYGNDKSIDSIDVMTKLENLGQLKPGLALFVPHECYFEAVEIQEVFNVNGDVHITKGFYTHGYYNDSLKNLQERRTKFPSLMPRIVRYVVTEKDLNQGAYLISNS